MVKALPSALHQDYLQRAFFLGSLTVNIEGFVVKVTELAGQDVVILHNLKICMSIV
jgi:hypothetical protein